ncbi:class I SAM-dependent methyltransferase [bacterium]|nr:class I SAM-dependent methyltransferase [bacterium]
MKKVYNPKGYWSKRLEENFSLSGVGFTSFGRNYNKWLYRMRKKVLERVVSRYKIDFPNIRTLDIGCGTGFYVDIWRQKGVRYLTGIDITAISIKELNVKYPNFDFHEADITSPTLIQDLNLREKSFDLITAFDVLFHIVDDNKFEEAIKNISKLCSQDGLIFITDIFPHKRPYIIFHQKSRLLKDYIQILSKNSIEIIDRVPIHYLLSAPLDISSKLLQDVFLNYYWSGIGLIERKTKLIGPIFFILDSILTRLFKESPSTEMIICKPESKPL